jgi:hypothetical protein
MGMIGVYGDQSKNPAAIAAAAALVARREEKKAAVLAKLAEMAAR